MLADERTLDSLDFDAIRERVIAATATERGRVLAINLHPFTDFARVRQEQAATTAVRDLMASADFHVRRAIDTRELTQTAALGRTLGPEELRAVADAIASAAAAYNGTRIARDDEASALHRITAPYTSLNDLVRVLTDAIDERGSVQDRASPALGRIRRALSQAQSDARDSVSRIARSGNRAIQDAVVTLRDGRFVVPVKAEFAGEFPGIVHDTSSSGQTVFVEPLAALDANNRVRTARAEEEHEIARILAALSRSVGERATQIEANIEMLAQLDVLAAKAHVAREMDAHAPELSDEAAIVIVDGRHPLLGAQAIPQSIKLDEQTAIVVISGPNMGGKTVALKMVGLFIAMVYSGMQIPAGDGTTIGRFTRIIADIGDEQSIAANASTFSAHLHRMREIIDAADERTVVLVDEIGGGTEPNAGAALAVAFLERLLERLSLGIVTTHATELKLFAHGAPGVTNASVRFDPQTFAPTYHLDIGAPGQSLAFSLAKSIGIDNVIIDRAQALLESRERDYESALAELAQRSSELQAERDRLRREREQLVGSEERFIAEREKLARQRKELVDRAEAQLSQALRNFVAELHRRDANARPKIRPSQAAALERTVEQVRSDLGVTPEEPKSKKLRRIPFDIGLPGMKPERLDE